MSRFVITLALGILIAFGGLTVPVQTIVESLDPGAIGHRLELVTRGVIILRVLLVLDGAMLVMFAIRGIRYRTGPMSEGVSARSGNSSVRSEQLSGIALAGLATILIVAAVLRFVNLNSDLWMDEVFTWVNYVQYSLGRNLSDFSDDNQHMLYSLLARVSVNLFGENPAALRLPAVLFGIGSLWATARLALLVMGKREALLSALLLAVSYHHIWFSQNARGYTLLLFGTVLATELFIRGIRSGNWRVWMAYAVVMSLTMWGHLTAVFVAMAHFLVVIGIQIRENKLTPAFWRALAAMGLAGWLTLHLYALVIPQIIEFFMQPAAGSTTAPSEWRNPLWLVSETLRHLGVGLITGWAGLLIAAGIFLWGLMRCLRRDAVFAVLMILPGLLLILTMIALGRSLWPRFFLSDFGFAAIIVISGTIGLGEAIVRLVPALPRLTVMIPPLLLCAVSAASVPRNYQFPKQDFTGARDFVRSRLGADDRVVGIHMAGRVYNRYYATEWPEVSSLVELQEHRARTGYTWVLYTLPGYLEAAKPDLMQVLEEEFERMRSFPGTLGDGKIIVCRSKQPGGFK